MWASGTLIWVTWHEVFSQCCPEVIMSASVWVTHDSHDWVQTKFQLEYWLCDRKRTMKNVWSLLCSGPKVKIFRPMLLQFYNSLPNLLLLCPSASCKCTSKLLKYHFNRLDFLFFYVLSTRQHSLCYWHAGFFCTLGFNWQQCSKYM